MTQRIAVFPADRHSLYEEHGYSAAIRSGDLLFVSGQVGSHTDGTPEPDFQKQVRLAFENLKATLQQLNDVMAVKQEIFALPPYPNWTAVGVTWLAGFDFEIKVIARIP
ncbi:RidA family protein [Salmonella enterica]|nr:RidA family protein [Salmonella enterica]EAU3443572.1 RidA family protein [Salmonella enterica]EBJ4258389.1 RidA family protein [Salmonella enterica]EBK9271763.1 RidA family protein [Salmonella enterica]ECS0152765.1 RidA family protein [Salmonella enterica]